MDAVFVAVSSHKRLWRRLYLDLLEMLRVKLSSPVTVRLP